MKFKALFGLDVDTDWRNQTLHRDEGLQDKLMTYSTTFANQYLKCKDHDSAERLLQELQSARRCRGFVVNDWQTEELRTKIACARGVEPVSSPSLSTPPSHGTPAVQQWCTPSTFADRRTSCASSSSARMRIDDIGAVSGASSRCSLGSRGAAPFSSSRAANLGASPTGSLMADFQKFNLSSAPTPLKPPIAVSHPDATAGTTSAANTANAGTFNANEAANSAVVEVASIGGASGAESIATPTVHTPRVCAARERDARESALSQWELRSRPLRQDAEALVKSLPQRCRARANADAGAGSEDTDARALPKLEDWIFAYMPFIADVRQEHVHELLLSVSGDDVCLRVEAFVEAAPRTLRILHRMLASEALRTARCHEQSAFLLVIVELGRGDGDGADVMAAQAEAARVPHYVSQFPLLSVGLPTAQKTGAIAIAARGASPLGGVVCGRVVGGWEALAHHADAKSVAIRAWRAADDSQ